MRRSVESKKGESPNETPRPCRQSERAEESEWRKAPYMAKALRERVDDRQ